LFPEAEAVLRRAVRRTRRPHLAAGLLTQLTDRIDGRVLDRSPRLRVISQCSVGVDNIDLEAARRRGITVMNTPGVLTEATADMTWALILSVARRVPEGDRICRSGRYAGWDLEYMLGRRIAGGTLGIVGAGRIGTAVARRAAGFGMRVLFHSRSRTKRPPAPGMRRVSLRRLLNEPAVVTLHGPAGADTRHMSGRRELSLMKATAILVNTSRGTIVDERALVVSLRRRVIWGAGLDVFEREPRIPAALRRLDNLVMTPHVASATRETRGAMALAAARNLVEFFRGRPDRSHVVV